MDAQKYRETRNRLDRLLLEALDCYAKGQFAWACSFYGRVAAIARELADLCGEEAEHEHSR